MSNLEPPLIEESNLSRAWGRVLLYILDHSGTKATPVLVSLTKFTDGEPEEDGDIRRQLDLCLRAKEKQSVHTVANTLFPRSLYRLAGYNRARLYELFLENYDRYVALEPSKNGRGMYFQRLIDYGPQKINQLEFIISQYRSRPGVRSSMFQATTFDPALDNTNAAQLAFPCMQQISFVPVHEGLVVNAFYASQQLFDKAYGNYLGICRLGNFVAREMGLPLARVNCFAGVLKLERIRKTDADLAEVARAARLAIERADGDS
jgi:hypothetical protein